MNIALNREGAVPVRDQLVAQLELKLLGGELRAGERLPSIRMLARRLRVHHNTVSAAYRDLEASGHVVLKRGSGVFVLGTGPASLEEARGLDEMIRLALRAAFARGFHGAEIRAAVERWLAAAPPDRVLVVDPIREMGELLAAELRASLQLSVTGASLQQLEDDPGMASGALLLALPYHVAAVRQILPSAAVEVLTLEVPAPEQAVIAGLPAGSIAVVVSHSASVLPFATVLFHTLRGEDVLVQAHQLQDRAAWGAVAPGADLVFADVLSEPVVRRCRPRQLRVFRVVSAATLVRLRDALLVVAPRLLGQH